MDFLEKHSDILDFALLECVDVNISSIQFFKIEFFFK